MSSTPVKRRRLARLAALSCLVVACHSWRVDPAPVAEVLEREDAPGRIRLTMLDGTTAELSEPRLEGDSVVGAPPGERGQPPQGRGRSGLRLASDGRGSEDRQAVALAEVAKVERRGTSAGRTVALVLVIPVGLVTFAALASPDWSSKCIYDCNGGDDSDGSW